METKRYKVLIVDDSNQMRDSLKEILIKIGYEVCGEAGDGAEAVTKCRSLKPDIVTLDMILPKMDGLQTLRVIRAFDSKIIVVMVTARADKSSVMDCAKAGASHYLLKPFDESKVAEVMRKIAPL
jgi:two-component system chemotaxis response regulator CheY